MVTYFSLGTDHVECMNTYISGSYFKIFKDTCQIVYLPSCIQTKGDILVFISYLLNCLHLRFFCQNILISSY